MSEIADIAAREILDSRGTPTVEADVVLKSGAFGRAAVPSGASTGAYEATELRDNNKKRFNGKGVLKAVQHVNDEIADELIGLDALNQMEIDHTLIRLDGTPNKSRLGANAVLAVSLAVAKAAAEETGLPLYRYIGGTSAHILPVPMMNVLNGGKHADNPIDIQEFMIMPVSAVSFKDAVRMGAEVFQSLKTILHKDGLNTNVGDEGGFAPAIKSAKEALTYLTKAVTEAGYKSGEDIVFALDAASSEFYKDGKYLLTGENKKYNASGIVQYYEDLVAQFPIKSIEDGCAEDDWDGWDLLTETLGRKIQLVGDDLFVTNVKRLKKGICHGIANSILVKVGNAGGGQYGATRGIQRRFIAPFGRNRRHDNRRYRRGHKLRTNQNGFAFPYGQTGKIQPVDPHRRRIGQYRRLCG